MGFVVFKNEQELISFNGIKFRQDYLLSRVIISLRKRNKKLFVSEVHPDSRRFKKAFNSALTFFDADEFIATLRILNRNKLDGE